SLVDMRCIYIKSKKLPRGLINACYILFFKLIDDIGPTSALTVTFLIPLFGIFWGHLILDEKIGSNTLLGALFVIVGTMLVTGFLPRKKYLTKPLST
ncbi:DMT family transporter, partial [Pseudoalteromonas aliena]|uniref:DMT family transporter n=1 Tax=Pseudoalteromonas aliena TaxID=247523 RepID=UPI0024954F69